MAKLLKLIPWTAKELFELPAWRDKSPDAASFAAWVLLAAPYPPYQRVWWLDDIFVLWNWRPAEELYEEGILGELIGVGQILITNDGVYHDVEDDNILTPVAITSGYINVDTELNEDIVMGGSYNFTPSRYHRGSDLFVWALDAFSGDDLMAQSNRAWARANLAEHVAFSDDSVLVPRHKPLHASVVKALRRMDGYPLLDEDQYCELEQQEEQEQWAEWGEREARQLLTAKMQEYLIDFINDGSLTEEQIEEAVEAHTADVVYAVAQHMGDRLYDEGSGFHFNYMMQTLDHGLNERGETDIAPILLALGLPIIAIGHHAVCGFCGQALQADLARHIWVTDAGGERCETQAGGSRPHSVMWRHDADRR